MRSVKIILLALAIIFAAYVVVASNSVIFEHSMGYKEHGHAKIIGQVRNTTNDTVTFVKIVATIYDKNNNMVGTGFTFTSLDNLIPGQTSPFDLTVMDSGKDFAKYSINIDYMIGSQSTYDDLEILQSRGSYEYGNFRVIGEVKNTGKLPARFVKIICTGFEKMGENEKRIAGVGFTFSTVDIVRPGQVSPFSLTIINPPRQIDSYLLQVQGMEG